VSWVVGPADTRAIENGCYCDEAKTLHAKIFIETVRYLAPKKSFIPFRWQYRHLVGPPVRDGSATLGLNATGRRSSSSTRRTANRCSPRLLCTTCSWEGGEYLARGDKCARGRSGSSLIV
jgi:hypothetical protein